MLLAFWQASAHRRKLPMVADCALGVAGTGSGNGVGGLPGVSPHVTGSLRSTPRGSNMTMSKSSSSPGVSTLNSLAMSSTPETPGPPGSMTRDPIRSAGVSARCRVTATEIVWPFPGSV